MVADDGGAEDAVLARRREHFDEAVAFPVGEGAVEVVEVVARHFDGDALLRGVSFVQADARHFGVGEGGPRDDRIIRLEPPKGAEQGVDRRVPRLVRGGVRELIRRDHVAARINGRHVGAQVFVHFHGSAFAQRHAD